MIKPHVREYSKGMGKSRKEYSYVGKPGERCSDCKAWKRMNSPKVVGGAGGCEKDGGALTWGGSLCADFIAREEE